MKLTRFLLLACAALVAARSAFAATLSIGYAPNPTYWGQTVTMTATLDTQGDLTVPTGTPTFLIPGQTRTGTAWAGGPTTYTSTATFPADLTTFVCCPPITTTLHVIYSDAEYTPAEANVSFTVIQLVPTVTFGGTSLVTYTPTATYSLTTSVVDNLGNPSAAAAVRYFYVLSASAPAGPPSSFGATPPPGSTTFVGSGTFGGAGSWSFTSPVPAPDFGGQFYWLWAIYDGNAFTGRGYSPNYVKLNVLPWSTQIVLTGLSPTASVGQFNFLTATLVSTPPVSGGYPGGCSFFFFDNGVPINTTPALLTSAFAAAFEVMFTTPGSHTYTATFNSSTCIPNFWAAATSNGVTTIVSGTSTPTTTTLQSSLNPSNSGDSVTFTARVNSTAGTPTGAVGFLDGGSQIGSGTLNGSGVATFTTSTLSVATHPMSAVYAGTATFTTSTSPTVDQVVNGAAPPPPPPPGATDVPALGMAGLLALGVIVAAAALRRLRV
jgi:hypothetical protein